MELRGHGFLSFWASVSLSLSFSIFFSLFLYSLSILRAKKARSNVNPAFNILLFIAGCWDTKTRRRNGQQRTVRRCWDQEKVSVQLSTGHHFPAARSCSVFFFSWYDFKEVLCTAMVVDRAGLSEKRITTSDVSSPVCYSLKLHDHYSDIVRKPVSNDTPSDLWKHLEKQFFRK